MSFHKEQVYISSSILKEVGKPIMKVPYPVPVSSEGKYGITYTPENMPLSYRRNHKIYCGTVELEKVIEVNFIEKWARCSTGKVDLDKNEFFNYRVDGEIIMVVDDGE